ncbi:MAG: PA2779 family protein [Deltaproteobacteria bacterium]|nr:PA2779 family protein [Deltaproteobacteria bacterium]
MRDLAQTKTGHKVVLTMIALAFCLALMPTRAALAGFVTTIDSQTEAMEADLSVIQKSLENKKVSETLAALGYSSDEIESRLARLSDAEIHSLAGHLDQAMIPAGDGTVGIIIAVVVIFLVALGVLSLMGKSVVVG